MKSNGGPINQKFDPNPNYNSYSKAVYSCMMNSDEQIRLRTLQGVSLFEHERNSTERSSDDTARQDRQR